MELELKFALPASEPSSLERALRRSPLIGRRRPLRQELHNTYYDTPEHALKRHAIALRVRRKGSPQQPQWVQTLKTAGVAGSALSQRGEWEHALEGDRLDAAALRGTPWPTLDPQGDWFAALAPVFTTTFERLAWTVQGAGFRVEVALDRGSVHIDGHTDALCELEIELLEGPPAALFEVAAQLGRHVALLPLHMSKAERAYRLAQGTLLAPLRAAPPTLDAGMDFAPLARAVLRECLLQFTANLNHCRASAAPELLHQARVGWRRWRTMLRLLGLRANAPDAQPLAPLLERMRTLRDLDVAATEVLPLYADAYRGQSIRRARHWAALQVLLGQEHARQREALQQQLADPAVGLCLLELMRWVETAQWTPPHGERGAARWLKKRVARLARQLRALPSRSRDAARQHRQRILAKRLRYGVEGLRGLLGPRRAKRWLRRATECQLRIGLLRDQQQAVALATRLQAHKDVLEFLRAAGLSRRKLRPFP